MASWNTTDGLSLADLNKLTKFHPQNTGIGRMEGVVGPGTVRKGANQSPSTSEPRVGVGRGARFKHLQKNHNQDFLITRQIENAIGTAHRLVPSTAHRLLPSIAHRPSIKQDQVELVRGTSRGWIPQELREEAMEVDPSVMKDLVEYPSVMEDLASDSRRCSWSGDAGFPVAPQKNLVLSPSGRYWTMEQPKSSFSVSQDSDKLIQDDSDETGSVEGQAMASSEMGESRYFTATSSMQSPNESFYSAITAVEVQYVKKKSGWGNYCEVL